MAAPLPPLDEFERQGIAEIRNRLGKDLPADLDTDFNLCRWVDGWKGDMSQIEPRLRLYIENRRLAKLDIADEHFDEMLRADKILQKVMKHFTLSLRPRVNAMDNTVFLVYRLENLDFIGLAKMLMPSEYMHFMFISSELMLRLVLRQEKQTGQRSGITLLYDMHGGHVQDFLNMSAPHMKVGTAAFQLQQDYFCNITHRVVCIRTPTLMSVLWEVSRAFMNENTRNKFIMFTEAKYRQHIFEYIDPSVVPVYYGGQWREDEDAVEALKITSWNLRIDRETCCITPEPILPLQYRQATEKSEELYHSTYIKPKHTFTVSKTVGPEDVRSKCLWYQFDASSSVNFTVYLENGENTKKLLLPKLTICTASNMEENRIVCGEFGPGNYVFEFENHSTYLFSLRLRYCILEEKVV